MREGVGAFPVLEDPGESDMRNGVDAEPLSDEFAADATGSELGAETILPPVSRNL